MFKFLGAIILLIGLVFSPIVFGEDKCEYKDKKSCEDAGCEWVKLTGQNATSYCRRKKDKKVNLLQILQYGYKQSKPSFPGLSTRLIHPGQAAFDSDISRLKKSFSPGQATRSRLESRIQRYLETRR